MSIQTNNSIGSNLQSNSNGFAASGAHNSVKPTFAELLAQLVDYTKGTTGDRLQKMILAKLGVTEGDLKNMSPEERDKVMKKVQDLLKKEMDAQKQLEETKNNQKIDVSV
ncbi:hypothetical protein [Paraburkholderia sp. BL17N1]|uniref:hypothetical protein n=1 Tax=Paraburkholderia sp. BL17N1 TaxID=1938798 RepID=UPI000EB5CBCD|nr:hypothetical protein [Paraburkholderia sp. BL17N1]RKR36242.1 hypothetical protein B0G82_4278 [Paraburkholderia sp. BL17N1]